MNISTQLKTRVSGASAEAAAEMAKKLGSPQGVQVEKVSSDEANVTIDTASLKGSAVTEQAIALNKRHQAATHAKDANFTQGQANLDRSHARSDKTEAEQSKNRGEELKTLTEKEQKDKAAAEAEIAVQERAKREAEATAFQEKQAVADYKTRGESMLADALGDPIKIAAAMDQLQSSAQHQALADAAGIKAHHVDDMLSSLRSKVAESGAKIESYTTERGFMLENAQRALKSAEEREASASEKDADAAKDLAESKKLNLEASQAEAKAKAQSKLASATDAQVVSDVSAAL